MLRLHAVVVERAVKCAEMDERMKSQKRERERERDVSVWRGEEKTRAKKKEGWRSGTERGA